MVWSGLIFKSRETSVSLLVEFFGLWCLIVVIFFLNPYYSVYVVIIMPYSK